MIVLILLYNLLISFRQRWTTTPRRFRWRSLRRFADSQTSLLLDDRWSNSHVYHTTSNLCQDCFQVVEQSSLISGSMSVFTRRLEWHQWRIPLEASNLFPSRRACHLCNVLWYSIKRETRDSLMVNIGANGPFLWLTIWKDDSRRWFSDARYIVKVFGHHNQPTSRRQLTGELSIREGL